MSAPRLTAAQRRTLLHVARFSRDATRGAFIGTRACTTPTARKLFDAGLVELVDSDRRFGHEFARVRITPAGCAALAASEGR